MQALTIKPQTKETPSVHQLDSGETDEHLIRQVASGRAICLGVLFERHHKALYQYCLQLTRNGPLSEDLVQEVFIKLLDKASSYRGEGSFKSWLYNIARNIAFDNLRKAKHRNVSAQDEVIEEGGMDQPNLEQVIAGNQNVQRITRALAALPENTREIIWLGRFVFENYEELGRALDCKASTARVRMHRAMQQLNETIIQIYGGPIDV